MAFQLSSHIPRAVLIPSEKPANKSMILLNVSIKKFISSGNLSPNHTPSVSNILTSIGPFSLTKSATTLANSVKTGTNACPTWILMVSITPSKISIEPARLSILIPADWAASVSCMDSASVSKAVAPVSISTVPAFTNPKAARIASVPKAVEKALIFCSSDSPLTDSAKI